MVAEETESRVLVTEIIGIANEPPRRRETTMSVRGHDLCMCVVFFRRLAFDILLIPLSYRLV